MRSIYIALIVFLVYSCTPEDPVIPNEEELITTVKLVLQDSLTDEDKIFQISDPDGLGGVQPNILSDTLLPNRVYYGTLEVLNEQNESEENISTEIREEASEHQLFYQSNSDKLVITYLDFDEDGFPLGLLTKFEVGQFTGVLNLTVVLRHEPIKNNPGVSMGDLSNAGGDTDFEIQLPIYVEN